MNSSSAGKPGEAPPVVRELALSPTQVGALFPFHVVFDREMKALQVGPSLAKVLPGLREGAALGDYLTLERPLISLNFPEVLEHRNSLFIFRENSHRLRLRGEMVPLPGTDTAVFLCSPWLPEPGEFRTTGLTFEDFPLHDSMPEFMNVVQSQRLSMEDLRRLSDKLRAQREALKAANSRAMEQNAQSRQLALIAARTDNGVVITDARGRIEWVNHAFERTTGFTIDEVRGRTPGSCLQGPGTDPATVEYIRGQLRQGLGFKCELLNYSKSGLRYWVAIEAQPIVDDAGKVTNFMAIESDVTARRDADFRRDLAYSVTTVLAEAKESGEAMHRILETIVESIGYQFGVVWRLNPATGRLYPVRIWSRPDLRNSWFETDTRGRTFGPGEGLPGSVWELNGPRWVADLRTAADFPRKDSAVKDGLHSCFACPIRVGGGARGVMEFYSRGSSQPDGELLRTLTALGNQIGQFMERQDAEAERRRVVSLLHSTLESTQDGIVVADLQKRFVTWNQRFLEIWGLTLTTTESNRDAALAHALSLVTQPEEFARRLDWWYSHPNESGEDMIHFRDGRVLRRNAQPQISEGAVIGRIFSYRDVTSAWQAEQAVRESEERYRVITSTASDGIITVDTGNVILFANEAAEQIFAAPRGSLPGRRLYEITGDQYRQMTPRSLLQIVRQALGAGHSRSVEIVGRTFDGRQIPLEVSFGKSRLQGRPVITGVIRDITARRQAEERLLQAMLEIEAANHAKSDFLASISHEIRTPLNSIAGLSELLRNSRLDGDERDMVNTIWAASESLLNLINDLLDFSKIEAGQIEIVNEEFDPVMVCERAAEIASARAQRKGLALVCTVQPAAPPRLIGDGNRISQILLNLITNGIKFTEVGSVSVEMLWQPSAGGKARVEFLVRDTGIGISPDDRHKVFEKFYRVDTQVGRRAGGTGLGLSIARLLAERMGGSLALEDAEREGSCFRLSMELPAAAAHEAPAGVPAGLTAVLLSTPEHLGLLERVWRSAGVRVTPFTDLDAGCAYVDGDGPCEVVLIDGAVQPDGSVFRRFFRLLALRGRTRSILIRPPHGTTLAPSPSGRLITLDFPLTPSRMGSALARVLSEEADAASVSPARAAGSEAETAAQRGPSRHVLLVEDNPDSQAYAARVFHKAGHTVTVAGSVFETLQFIRSGVYDVIFMDVMLPDGSGFEAARKIREYEAQAGHPRSPIVALTANAMQEYRERAFDADMDDYLTKPVRPDALVAAVRKWAGVAVLPASAAPAETEQSEDAGAGQVPVDPDLADLIPGYLARVRVNADEIESLASAGDADGIRRAGHNLKGSGAAYGFPEITDLGRQIETAGKEENAAAAGELARSLRRYLGRVRWTTGP